MPALRRRQLETPVDFEIECDDFTVDHRAFEGLRCSATYRAWGTVTEDRSGDHVTPNGAPEVKLDSERVAYDIVLVRDDLCVELPKGLQGFLMEHLGDEFDRAFIAAKGGMCSLEFEAMERAA